MNWEPNMADVSTSGDGEAEASNKDKGSVLDGFDPVDIVLQAASTDSTSDGACDVVATEVAASAATEAAANAATEAAANAATEAAANLGAEAGSAVIGAVVDVVGGLLDGV
jgi:hypothetical protein